MRIIWAAILTTCFAGVAAANPNVLAAVNAERAAKGRAALVYDDRLAAAAQAHGSRARTFSRSAGKSIGLVA